MRRWSKLTLSGGSLASPVASAVPHPPNCCYVSEPYSRISTGRQLQAAASGKCGIKYFEGDRKGYFRVDLTHRRWATDLRFVERVGVPDAGVYTEHSWVVEDGQPGAQPAQA